MYINVNNIKIHYEVLGKGKPIILLNPNSVNTNFMKFIAKKLSNDFLVYIFDRRCCGKSQKDCELSYEESAKDVYEFIKKLNIDKPYILGSSGGGSVALNIAVNYPDSISKLVICSGVARMDVIKKPQYAKIMEKIPWYPGKKNNMMFEKLNTEAKTLSIEDLEKIKIPTLVVNGGKKDIVPRQEAEYIASSIKNSELLILDNEGHASYMINCKWYQQLKDFLDNN